MIEKLPDDKSAGQWIERFVCAGARDLDLAEGMVEAALLAGAEEAEVYLKTSATSGIHLHEGFATLAGGAERGVALRVFDAAGRWGHAFASWGDPELTRRLVQSALAALQAASESAMTAAPAPRPAAPFPEVEGVLDARVFHRSPADKRSVLEEALRRAAGGSVPRLAASWRDGISRVALVNSRGLKASFHRTLALMTLVRSEAGGPTLLAERVGCGIGPGEIGETAEEILRLDGSARVESIVPGILLLRSSAAAALMRQLERRVLPAAAQSGESAGSGRRVGAPGMELVDDPLLPGGVASSPFDGEGYPTRPLTILRSGVLTDPPGQLSGAGGSRGNSVRPSYRVIPSPGWTNLLLIPGRRPWTEMLRDIEQGILLVVLDLDPSAGPPDREAAWCGIGWNIRGGEAVGPCRRYIFRAETGRLLEGVCEISSESRFTLHRSTALGCPDLLIRLGG